jgi:hypothetical protein
MMEYIDITKEVLAKSNLPVIIDKFRQKACSYPMVKRATLSFQTIEARRVAPDRFLFQTRGEVEADPLGLPQFRLKFTGAGEYKREERRVYLNDFRILNDFAGLANKLVEVIGIAAGRSLHVNQNDDELLLSLLPEQVG